MANKIQLPQETVDIILDNYCNKKYGLIKSGKEVGVSSYIVRRLLLEKGIHIRSFSEAAVASNQTRRLYSVNDDYFSTESHNMAYFLGFLAADGTVNKDSNQIKIGLSSVDKDFLEQLRQEIEAEHPIISYQTANGYNVSELKFSSSKIKQDLSKYNIIPRKTYSFSFPINLDRKYWIDFIRGYFDGDGSVSTAGPSAIRFQICSYRPQVLETIVNYLYKEYDIPKVSIQQQMKESGHYLYNFQYSNSSTRKLFDILYYPGCLCLPRKYEKFKSII